MFPTGSHCLLFPVDSELFAAAPFPSSAREVPPPYAVRANIDWIFGQAAGAAKETRGVMQTGYPGVMSRLLPACIHRRCIRTMGATRKRLTLWDFFSTTTVIGINRILGATFCFSIV